MKRFLPFVIAALMIPGVALAKGKPPTAGTHTNKGKAKVQYILKGDLSAFSALSSPSTNGNITILVLDNGVTVITDGDQGIVKVRAPKEPRDTSGSDLAAILTALPVRQVID